MPETKLLVAICAPLYWGATHSVFGPAAVGAVLIAAFAAWVLTPVFLAQ